MIYRYAKKGKLFFIIKSFFITLCISAVSFLLLFASLYCLSDISQAQILQYDEDIVNTGVTEHIEENFFINFLDPNPQLEPGIFFKDRDEENLSLKSLRGKIVILYFFATWCSNCQIELQHLSRLIQQTNFLDVEDIVVLPISVDYKDNAAIADMFATLNIQNLNFVRDINKNAMSILGVKSLPTTVVVDKKGRVVCKIEQTIPWHKQEVSNALLALRSHTRLEEAASEPTINIGNQDFSFKKKPHNGFRIIM